MTATNQYKPDYAVSPGSVLEERLEVQGISHAEFARRCGRSAKLISEIIAGKAPVEPQTALQFEKVLGVDASIWLGIESSFQLHRAREEESAHAKTLGEWLELFPLRELVKRGYLRDTRSSAESVSQLLAFFRVASVEAWTAKHDLAHVSYRHSPSFKSNPAALATWLRLGELEAEKQICADYSANSFRHAMKEVRRLTRMPVSDALDRAEHLCNEAGVALALIKPFPKTALSGAAWWITPRKAIIELSARHKSDDHLWFSFFHEAAHILLHSKRCVFVDGVGGDDAEFEAQADEWASNMLIPRRDWQRFVATSPRRKVDILAFAKRQEIAPGIVVGMLQHAGFLPWTHLNGLKVRYKWEGA